MAKSQFRENIEKEFERVTTEIATRTKRTGKTDLQLLQDDPFLCGQAYVLSRLLVAFIPPNIY